MSTGFATSLIPKSQNTDYVVNFLDKITQAALKNPDVQGGVKLRHDTSSVTAFSGMSLNSFSVLEDILGQWFGTPSELMKIVLVATLKALKPLSAMASALSLLPIVTTASALTSPKSHFLHYKMQSPSIKKKRNKLLPCSFGFATSLRRFVMRSWRNW
jgi:hypothetical protein